MPSAATSKGSVRIVPVDDQKQALTLIAQLIQKGSLDKDIRNTALIITEECRQRDDMCELQAIFDAVKNGTNRVPALARGLKYMADPRFADFFTSASRLLKQCTSDNALCAEDCDGHTILVGAMCATLGWQVGARAWGPTVGRKAYTHVFAGVLYPKRNGKKFVAMDTTVPKFGVGDQPPRGEVMTAYID